MFGKKVQYFLDYYLLKTAAVLFCVGAAVFFIVNFFRNPPDTALYAAVYDITADKTEAEALAKILADRLGPDVKPTKVLIDDTFRSDSRKDVERVQVLSANHAVDVIIAPEKEIMTGYAAYGYLTDHSEVLSDVILDRAEKDGRLIRTPGMLWSDEISFEDHESGQGPEKPYVLDLSGSSAWTALTGNTETAGYLGVVIDTPHKGAVRIFTELLFDEETSP